MHDMEENSEHEDQKEDYIHPKNTITIETKDTNTQQ